MDTRSKIISITSSVDEIYRHLNKPIQRIAKKVYSRSTVRDRDADDLASDAMLFVIERIERLRCDFTASGEQSFSEFLLRKIEQHLADTCRTETRRNQRRAAGGHDVAQRASVTDDDAIQAIDDSDEAEALLGKIDTKNSQGREIVERTFGLHGREQQSGIEIADTLGVAPGTVSKAKQRALREIQKAIEDEADAPPS